MLSDGPDSTTAACPARSRAASFPARLATQKKLLRQIDDRLQVNVTVANCAEIPQYLLVSDRVALVRAYTAKIFLERFPTLDVCEISFQMSRWSFLIGMPSSKTNSFAGRRWW